MNDMIPEDVIRDLVVSAEFEHQVRTHMALLGHDGLGVTELRVFDPFPRVAYVDNPEAVIGLCHKLDGKTTGIYVGVQPRPACLFDLAPNRWVPARGGASGNCSRDDDIEYITAVFFDLDVVSPQRAKGHPASDEELRKSLRSARLLAQRDGLAGHSTICGSGNGHYVLVPVVPVSGDSDEIAGRFRAFCQAVADTLAGRVAGVRIDSVYNLSRVMRVMGTPNMKGQVSPGRPHRRACFVTEPPPERSLALHHMILNADIQRVVRTMQPMLQGLKCDLARIEECEFIRFCRRNARLLSEPQWVAAVTNLAPLEGGVPLIHEISSLDPVRYDPENTQRLIDRVQREGYKPFSCKTIVSSTMTRPGRGVFRCSRIARCPARAPMYMAVNRTVYSR